MAVAGRLSRPEWQRYADPATELEVLRLTDPSFASGFTAPHLRQFGRRSDTLLYWSERFGVRQAFQLDLKSGDSHQLTEAAALDVGSIALSVDERSLCYFDGASLMESPLSSLRARELHKVPEGVKRAGMTRAADGSLMFVESQGGTSRILRTTHAHGGIVSVAEAHGAIDLLMARPRRAQALYRTGGELWLVNQDGSGKIQLKPEAGQTGEVVWTQSGRTLLYLHIPEDPKQLITLRENDPDEKTDRLLARTSQFEAVAPNGDSSVFVGASRSRASSYVLLLLRVTRRELTLCEHHASDPHMVLPIFSPDSQSVFFASDRHGKAALYRVHIEKFVEETSADSAPQ
jgi:oligogalacturonide lyase